MNREDIIRMAREVGMTYMPHITEISMQQVIAFAKLVAQHEREACAKLCEEMRTYVGRNNAVTQSSAQDCATAIRARKQT
jgi:hypothetical protein